VGSRVSTPVDVELVIFVGQLAVTENAGDEVADVTVKDLSGARLLVTSDFGEVVAEFEEADVDGFVSGKRLGHPKLVCVGGAAGFDADGAKVKEVDFAGLLRAEMCWQED
jgi:hypothetical protein